MTVDLDACACGHVRHDGPCMGWDYPDQVCRCPERDPIPEARETASGLPAFWGPFDTE